MQKEILFRQVTPSKLAKGELRKFEIVQATIRCLATLGYHRTNYETIGTFCHMKRPHVAYHFPDRDELIDTALRFSFATGQSIVVDYLKEAKTPPEKLESYIKGTFHWFHSHPEHSSVVTLLFHLATQNKHHRTMATEFKKIGMDRLRVILHDLKVKPNRLNEITWAIHAMLVGNVLYSVTCNPIESTSLTVQQTIKSAWALLKMEKAKEKK